jgi:ribosomal protein L29
MPVRTCRVKSSEASSKTLTHRTRALTELRTSISGGDTSAQLRAEIKALSKEEREEVLKEAHLPIAIPPDHALAMKADLALPWSKMRVISR